jgi:hypothetical protein
MLRLTVLTKKRIIVLSLRKRTMMRRTVTLERRNAQYAEKRTMLRRTVILKIGIKRKKINFFAEVAETSNSEATINNRMYVVDSGSICHMTNIKAI